MYRVSFGGLRFVVGVQAPRLGLRGSDLQVPILLAGPMELSTDTPGSLLRGFRAALGILIRKPRTRHPTPRTLDPNRGWLSAVIASLPVNEILAGMGLDLWLFWKFCKSRTLALALFRALPSRAPIIAHLGSRV